jgi:hypothetical protein
MSREFSSLLLRHGFWLICAAWFVLGFTWATLLCRVLS